MDIAQKNTQRLLSLPEAARKLAVSVDTLLKWNEYQILKPTITPSGSVGYREEQLNQFLTIRQALQQGSSIKAGAAQNLPTTPVAPNMAPVTKMVPQPVSSTAPVIQKELNEKPVKTINFSSLTFFGSFLTLGIALGLVTYSSLHLFSPTITHVSQNQSVAGRQTDTVSVNTTTVAIDNQDTGATNKNLQVAGQGNSQEKLTSALSDRKNEIATAGSTQEKQVLGSSHVATLVGSLQQAQNDGANPSPAGAADVTTMASTAHTQSQSQNALDTSGNPVKDSQTNSLLAMGIPQAGFGTPPLQNANSLASQIVFLSICAGIAVFFLKRPKTQPAPAMQQEISPEKVLEIGQRMDGTVVFIFQGKQYKISKPELYSDSDRFFERLIELLPAGAKEIEYDSFTDNAKLAAPLSRLVTRLGFVGIKRDLFFPRTSKNRVLFRRYITKDDLRAMNLTTDQLARQLFQTSATN